MFGFIYAFILAVSGIKDYVKNEHYTKLSKENSIKNNKDTYYDGKGNEYYKDKKVITMMDYNPNNTCNGESHRIIKDIKTGDIIKDYTQDIIDSFFYQREKIIDDAKKHGDLYYEIYPPNSPLINKYIYQNKIKGYCGFFETESGRRYLLGSEYKKLDGRKHFVYYKYYYKEPDSKHVVDDFYYELDYKKRIIISKEEYLRWGGFGAENKNYISIPKGGVI